MKADGPSPSRIYWPGAWGDALSKAKPALVVAAIASAMFGVLAGWMFSARDYELALLSIYLFSIGPPAIAIAYLIGRRGLRRGWTGVRLLELLGRPQSAALIPYGRTQKYVYLVGCLAFALYFAAFPVIVFVAPWESSRYPKPAVLVLAGLAQLATLYFLAVLVSRVVRKRGQLGVGLSAEGIYHWSWFGCCFFAWDWIRSVEPREYRRAIVLVLDVVEPRPRPWDPEENWVARLGVFRQGKVRIPVGFLAVNPAVPLYAIEFYRRHPELRHELGTEQGLERIRNGDLPDVIREVYNNGRFKPE